MFFKGVLIVDRDRYFRAAGYRVPNPGERYLNRRGSVSTCVSQYGDDNMEALILAELNMEKAIEEAQTGTF